MSIEQHLQKLRDSDIHACLAAVSELGDLVAARRDRSFTKGMIGPELVAAIERFTSNDLQEHFVFGERYGLRRGKAYELVVNYLCDLSDCNSSETNRTASSGLFSFFKEPTKPDFMQMTNMSTI